MNIIHGLDRANDLVPRELDVDQRGAALVRSWSRDAVVALATLGSASTALSTTAFTLFAMAIDAKALNASFFIAYVPSNPNDDNHNFVAIRVVDQDGYALAFNGTLGWAIEAGLGCDPTSGSSMLCRIEVPIPAGVTSLSVAIRETAGVSGAGHATVKGLQS